MRRAHVFIATALVASMFVPVAARSQDAAFVSGTVLNPIAPQIVVGAEVVPLDSDGAFTVRIPLDKPGYFVVGPGSQFMLYLSPGDDLTIEYDARYPLKTMTLFGSGAVPNEYLKRFFADKSAMTYGFFREDRDAFLKSAADVEAGFYKKLDEFVAENRGVGAEFVRFERARIAYWWADVRLQYGDLSRRFGASDTTPKDAFDRYLAGLDLNDPSLLEFDQYGAFLFSLVQKKAQDVLADNADLRHGDNQIAHAKFRVADDVFTDREIKQWVMFALVEEQIENYGIKGIEPLVERFEKACDNAVYRDRVAEMIRINREQLEGHRVHVYKTIDGVTLDVHVFKPEGLAAGAQRPAVVLFHGGGWAVGKPEWGFRYCRYFSSLGMVAMSVQYRLIGRHDITPLECMVDAKSAFRWVRENAAELNVDSERIVGAGWSAGAHIATSAVVFDGFNDPKDDLDVSAAPNALVMWFPALRVTGDAWFVKALKGRADPNDCSPTQHVRPGLPPAIIFHGTEDRVVPYWKSIEFANKMKEAGNRCDLHPFEGRPHVFTTNRTDSDKTLQLTAAFLASLGYIENN